jgi:hypothetical protein
MGLARLRHAHVADSAHESRYARSGEEAGVTADGKSGHVPKRHGAERHVR